MKKNKEDQVAQNKNITNGGNILLKGKRKATKEKTTIGQEEYEEDRSPNIRMKPQPLVDPIKTISVKKKRKKEK